MRARLALVEWLLATVDLQQSAGFALEWLARHCDVPRTVCFSVADGKRLMPTAEMGLGSLVSTDVPVYLDDQNHPLVVALRRAAPSRLNGLPPPLGAAFRRPIDAFPLRGHAAPDGTANGLLLADSIRPEYRADVHWAVGVLGEQMARLRSRDVLAETRFGRERLLLMGTLNAVTDPILLTDAEGRLIVANTVAERFFTAPDDASDGLRQAVALNNMLFSAALSSSALDSGGPSRRELVLVDASEGSDLLFELLSTPLRSGSDGTVIASVLRNVTDLGRATREIRDSYDRLRLAQAQVRDQGRRLDLIIDSVADPILVTDAAGDIALMNARAERLFAAQAGASSDVAARVHGNAARFSSFASGVLASGAQEVSRGEMTLVDPRTNVPMPVEAIAGAVLTRQGELIWIVTILHDRTESVERALLYEEVKRASLELEERVRVATRELAEQNETLRRQQLELEQASALKSQFLANMSHEFRTPLNAILGYTQILLQGISGTIAPGQRGNLASIDANARQMLSLVNEVLDLSRIEAGRMPISLTQVDVAELIESVMTELRPLIEQSNLAVTAEAAPGLPPIEADQQKARQILVNLLTNALKFTPRGSICVRARRLPQRPAVAVAVQDTGIGIPTGELKSIFEDFRQVDSSTSREHGGAGLGLSISRRLAEMMGADITVHSQVGKGSTFTVSFPLAGARS